MGNDRPRGLARVIVNILMGIAALAATGAGVSAVIKKFGEALAMFGG
jgi:hypothetical protein